MMEINFVPASWLPNIEDKDSKELHTGYIATISFSSFPAASWQMIARFDKFYRFYCKFYRQIADVFPRGMLHNFPDDRWKSRFFGVDDNVRNLRQKGLDLWFREICINPRFMLDLKLRSALYEFLDVFKNQDLIDRISALTISEKREESHVIAPNRRASVGSVCSSTHSFDKVQNYKLLFDMSFIFESRNYHILLTGFESNV